MRRPFMLLSVTPSRLLIFYGSFLVLSGLLGYAATHATSTSALLNGGIFGSLMILLGVLVKQGRMWTYPAAMAAAGIFTITFAWRAVLQWGLWLSGDQERLIVAFLLTIMFGVSAVVTRTLIAGYRS